MHLTNEFNYLIIIIDRTSRKILGSRVSMRRISFFLFFIYNLINSIQAKKKATKKQKNQASSHPIQIPNELIIGFLVVSILYIIYFVYSKRQAELRALKLVAIKQAIQNYQLSKKDKSCTLTQLQKQQSILWFKNQTWVLQQSEKKQKNYVSKLNLSDLKRKNQPLDQNKFYKDYYDAYYVSFKGNDKYGKFDIFGVIMFEKYFMTLFFEKSYSNNKNSKGEYQFKFFSGIQKKGTFQGKWFNSNQSKVNKQSKSLIQSTQQDARSERSFSRTDGQKSNTLDKKYQGRFKLSSSN